MIAHGNRIFRGTSRHSPPDAEGMPMSRGNRSASPPNVEAATESTSTPTSSDSEGGADLTALLIGWSEGDETALETLLPVVYGELRRQARRALRREAVGHTLQPTALVHEAYLRLVDQRPIRWEGRAHFFRVAARCMRQVLVDAARTRQAAKRGHGAHPVTLADAQDVVASPSDPGAETGLDVLALDEALDRLAAMDPDQARLVELRYFAGLTLDETAAALGVSSATVSREWAVARRWLRRELAPVRRSAEALE
jgi:RNA polymerase sigma factor (TIGR02999 family)